MANRKCATVACQACGGPTIVRDTTHNYEDRETYRKRICLSCFYAFWTIESEVEFTPEFKEAYNRYYRR